MAFQTPITIAEAIRNIEQQRYLLPSIQREFTWSHEKIEWLFDSVMRDYPVSSFLFWEVEDDTTNKFKFYKFIQNFRQKYNTHNEEVNASNLHNFTAILDGQQRLTSFYIGLRGSYAYKTLRLKEENSERSYPTRYLFLNVSKPLEVEEDGRIYEFKFLTVDDVANSRDKWFRVSDIYKLSDDFEFNEYLDLRGLKSERFSYQTVSTLKNVIHSKQMINFFLEKDQNIDKALNIFIRINSGGEPLNFSDLIMSIAVANWEQKDARREIHTLVDNIRDKGFSITKDFILKCFLYLHSKDIKFKVSNFSKTNAEDFEKQWNKIRDTILTTFDLIKSFGFTEVTLVSKNAIIPIVYYLYHRDLYKDFSTKIAYEEDRVVIKRWLHTALIKRLLGGSSDGTLGQIRRAFTNDVINQPVQLELSIFPAEAINKAIGRDAAINDEFIEELLNTQISHKYAFSLLALLYPNLDYKNNNFHKDHLHPASHFDDLTVCDKERYGTQAYNSLKNLLMLDANENMSKGDSPLEDWVRERTKNSDRKEFLTKHLIPDIDLGIANFGAFIEKRTEILADNLRKILS